MAPPYFKCTHIVPGAQCTGQLTLLSHTLWQCPLVIGYCSMAALRAETQVAPWQGIITNGK